MPIWRAAPVEEQPTLTLVDWRIVETECGERHFVGYALETASGRVSSAIQRYDLAARRGMTHSGRIYQLTGEPGRNGDAEYVWAVWVHVNAVPSWQDVTEALLSGAD